MLKSGFLHTFCGIGLAERTFKVLLILMFLLSQFFNLIFELLYLKDTSLISTLNSLFSPSPFLKVVHTFMHCQHLNIFLLSALLPFFFFSEGTCHGDWQDL